MPARIHQNAQGKELTRAWVVSCGCFALVLIVISLTWVVVLPRWRRAESARKKAQQEKVLAEIPLASRQQIYLELLQAQQATPGAIEKTMSDVELKWGITWEQSWWILYQGRQEGWPETKGQSQPSTADSQRVPRPLPPRPREVLTGTPEQRLLPPAKPEGEE